MKTIATTCLLAIALMLSAELRMDAQRVTLSPCGTYPRTLQVFSAMEIHGVPVIIAESGLYTYDWATNRTTLYNEENIVANPIAGSPVLTIAPQPGLNGRLFGYTPGQGHLKFSDDHGRTWQGANTTTGTAAYSGIAVLDSGVIIATTEYTSILGRGVSISFDNGDNWNRLTEPHSDTGAISPSISSCYGRGRYAFYNSETQGPTPGVLVATFDGGKTWQKQSTLIGQKSRIIYGDDSVVVFNSGASVIRENFRTNERTGRSFPFKRGTYSHPTAFVDGEHVVMSVNRTDSEHIANREVGCMLIIDTGGFVIDSLYFNDYVFGVTRIGPDYWVFHKTRISKVSISNITAPMIKSSHLTDASLQSVLLGALNTPVPGLLAQTRSNIVSVRFCADAEPEINLSPLSYTLNAIAHDSNGAIFCSDRYLLHYDYKSQAIVDLHRNLPLGFGGYYSRLRSVHRSKTGRLIGGPYGISKTDNIGPVIHLSDDNGETWRTTTRGLSPRLTTPETAGGGKVGSSSVIGTSRGTILIGMYNGSSDADQRDSATAGSGLYRSTDDGETWNTPTDTLLQRTWIRDLTSTTEKVYALSSDIMVGQGLSPSPVVQLYVSDDDARTWNRVAGSEQLGLTEYFRVTAYLDTLYLYDIGPTGNVRYLVDIATTFKPYWEPESGSLLWFTAGPWGVAATTTEGVFVPHPTTSGIEEKDSGGTIQRDGIPWVVVSPVPADDGLTVKFSNLGDFIDGFVSAKMYSTASDVVADFTEDVRRALSTGTITFSVDCKPLAAGVYVVHMAAGRDSRTRKVMIRK